MNAEFKVTCSATFTSGKFAPREDVIAEIVSSIEGADPSSMSVGDGEYEVSDWNVEEVSQPTPKQLKHQTRVDDARKQLLLLVLAYVESSRGTIHSPSAGVIKAADRFTRLINPQSKPTAAEVPNEA